MIVFAVLQFAETFEIRIGKADTLDAGLTKLRGITHLRYVGSTTEELYKSLIDKNMILRIDLLKENE